MPSPFPGMDPYLESQGLWPDFHASFITYLRDMLSDLLPARYEVRMDERVNLVEHSPESIKRIGPDVAILQHEPTAAARPTLGGVATLEPVTIPLVIEEETRESYIRIIRRPEQTLVAVLELLSPANKQEPGRGVYLAKRSALLRQDVHLMELDFLLGGHRLALQRPLPTGDYYALISRGDSRPDCHVYSWTVQQPLPTLPVPLKAPDPDLAFDLGAVFSITYDRGRYERSVDYEAPPSDCLGTEARNWVLERVKSWN